jgi:hypothetical protein
MATIPYVIGEYSNLVIDGITSGGSFVLPTNAYLVDILVTNTTGNAITGGLKFGTSAGAIDVVTAMAMGANALGVASVTGLLKKFFSSSQTIYYDAVTLWNSANVTIEVIYQLRK